MKIRHLPSRLTSTDRLMIGWWMVNLVVFGHVVVFETPLWLTYAYNGILYGLGVAISSRSDVVRNIFILGTVSGVIELGADHFLVETAGSLVYPEGLPMLLSSPLYMPLAWAIVITQLGYLGYRLNDIFGRKLAAVGPAVTAVALIGVYEYGAFFAGIWAYESASVLMVGHVPLYIVVAEGVMFGTLHEFVRVDRPLIGGLGFGFVITFSFIGGYALFTSIAGILT